MADLKYSKKNKKYSLEMGREELDVVYRLLCCTKQNETETRFAIAKNIRDEIKLQYANDLSFEEDEKNSQDHFGMVCFTGSKSE